MAELINPGVKSNYEMSGPLAGYYAAQQMQDWRDAQDRAFRTSDITDASSALKLSEAQADVPVNAIKRENALAAGQSEADAWRSGENERIAAAKRQEMIAKAVEGKSDAEMKVIANRASAAVAASNEVGAYHESDPYAASQWDAVRERYKKQSGLDIGEYSAQNHARLTAAAKAGTETIGHIQAKAVEKMKDEAAMARVEKQGENSLAVAGVHERASNYAANKHLEAAKEASRLQRPDMAAQQDVDNAIKEGKVVDDQDLARVLSFNKLTNPNWKDEDAKALVRYMGSFTTNRPLAEQAAKESGISPDNTQALATWKVKQDRAEGEAELLRRRFGNGKVAIGNEVKLIKQLTAKDVLAISGEGGVPDSGPAPQQQTQSAPKPSNDAPQLYYGKRVGDRVFRGNVNKDGGNPAAWKYEPLTAPTPPLSPEG